MKYAVSPSAAISATVTVPGDKSISHRALMLGAIADGETSISGFLNGEDCLATLQAIRQLGVRVDEHTDATLTVNGVGLTGLQAPSSALDMGNAGTAMRLMAGLLSGQAFRSQLIGDASLTSRPMGRIIRPLTKMGASIESESGKPPLRIEGGPLRSIEYNMPMASAQVKSAVLIAGIYGDGTTVVVEPATTRDHTERMLRSMGAQVSSENGRISMSAGQRLRGGEVQVPADLSSAAFVILAALLSENADITIENVGVNPTRTGILDILQAMGGQIELLNPRSYGDEPVADLRVVASTLRGIEVDPALVSLAIDEFPVLFVAAAAAAGQTTFTGIGELRVKESDRIATMANGMRALGIEVEESPDGAIVHGGQFHGGEVGSHGDHRVGMALAVAGASADAPVTVHGTEAVETSFPGFTGVMAKIGLVMSVEASQ